MQKAGQRGARSRTPLNANCYVFSMQWRAVLWCSGLWHRIVWYMGTNSFFGVLWPQYPLCATSTSRKEIELIFFIFILWLITVAGRSKAWTVFVHSNTGIAGSYPTSGMDVYVRVFCVCVVLCAVSGFPTGRSPVQGVLPTVYKIKTTKKRPRPNKGL
jgi:hypothetical protein